MHEAERQPFEESGAVARIGSDPGHVEAREAARLLGISQRAVRNLIGRKTLEGKRDGEGAAARLVVSVASVERLRSEQQREKGEG